MSNEKRNYDFEKIIDEHGEALIRLAYFYLKDWSTAEDIVQETLIRFYERQHQFNEQSSLYTYLYRITINLCHDHVKKWSTRMILLTNKLKHPFTNKGAIEQKVVTKDTNEQLAIVILELPVIYREAIILFYYYDLKVYEIAELLDIPENTIKSRLYRARGLLRESSLTKSLEVEDYE